MNVDKLIAGSNPHTVELDWDAYFLEFQALHGGEPVFHQPTRRLLFRDGWMYSASDTKGPEWAPPSDPTALRRLLVDYWDSRRVIIRTRLEILKGQLSELKEMQRLRSAPLQCKVRMTDETNKSYTKTTVVDTTIMETQIELLTKAVDECDEELRKLTAKDEET